MKRTYSYFLVFFFALIAGNSYAQQPHWFVLLEPGNEQWYWGQNGHAFHELVTGYQDGYSVVENTHYYEGEVLDTQEELWLIDPGGDVWLGNTCYIDMPLDVGKSWGRTWGEYDQYYDRFTIMGWDDYWGLHCVRIREITDFGAGTEIITNRWYADGVGLVHWEISCAYCSFHLEQTVVETESITLGGIKSLFR